MKFIINKPSVWLYKTDNLLGEVSDELLFGTVIEILSENDTTVFCRTDYGYTGYLNKWELCECETEDCDIGSRVTLYRRCDLLSEPCYRLAPCMSLYKGSRVKYIRKCSERFGECIVGNRIMYIPEAALVKNEYKASGAAISETALSYLGTPYRWGGKSESGIDCSGLVFMCAQLCGLSIYRDSVPDERYVVRIPEDEVRAGDIVYFPGHVAVMTGKTSFVHASASKGYVVCDDFKTSELELCDVVCFARIVG